MTNLSLLCKLCSSNKLILLLFIIFTPGLTAYGQTVEIWDYSRMGYNTGRVNLLVNGQDSMRIGIHLSSTTTANRRIVTMDDQYRFEFQKATQQEILYNSADEKLAICSGKNISFFNCVTENGDRYTIKKSGGRGWDYYINDQLAIKGHLENGNKFKIHIIQDNQPGIELAKIMSYAYTSEIAHNKQTAPIYVGLIVTGVLMRFMLATASDSSNP